MPVVGLEVVLVVTKHIFRVYVPSELPPLNPSARTTAIIPVG